MSAASPPATRAPRGAPRILVVLFIAGAAVVATDALRAQGNLEARFPSFWSASMGAGYVAGGGYAGELSAAYIRQTDLFSAGGTVCSPVPFHSDTTLIQDAWCMYGRIARVHGGFLHASAGIAVTQRRGPHELRRSGAGLALAAGYTWVFDESGERDFRWTIGVELYATFGPTNPRLGALIRLPIPIPVGP